MEALANEIDLIAVIPSVVADGFSRVNHPAHSAL